MPGSAAGRNERGYIGDRDCYTNGSAFGYADGTYCHRADGVPNRDRCATDPANRHYDACPNRCGGYANGSAPDCYANTICDRYTNGTIDCDCYANTVRCRGLADLAGRFIARLGVHRAGTYL